MSLHSEIMELECQSNEILTYLNGREHSHGSYEKGWSEARQVAAELAIKTDALIERLLDALERRHADDYVDSIREEFNLYE